ncbi:phage tail assembly protein [Ralstonia solanacearum]|uniref:phage tail assembly protein n=1 Tax=Ralstonia solanacearum TaxID=305 RepID=UPI0005AC283E|nr:phage tail assembly protein [Ralstonia solanacearum]
MALTKTTHVTDRDVQVRELTVQEVRDWYAALATSTDEVDVVGLLLFGDVTLGDIERMTDLTPAALATLAPSDVARVIADVKEVNPHFFDLRERLRALGAQSLPTAALGLPKLNAPPVP